MKITMSNGNTFNFDTTGSELETLMTAMLGAYGIKPEKEEEVPENMEKVGNVMFFSESGEDITSAVIAGGKRPPVKYVYVSDDVHGKTVAAHFFPTIAEVHIPDDGCILTWIAPLGTWVTPNKLHELYEYIVQSFNYYDSAEYNFRVHNN